MKFLLEAEFTLSGEIPQEKLKDFDSIIEEANRTILTKGVEKGVEPPKVTDYKIFKEHLHVTIESGEGVRAHVALLRLRKFLNEVLGKTFRMGVRKLEIKNYLIKEIPLPFEPIEEITVPFADINLKNSNADLSLRSEELSIDHIEKGAVDRLIKLVQQKVERQRYTGKDEYKREIWFTEEKETYYDKDPAVELENWGWIRRTYAKAQFVYGPQFTVMVNVLKELFIETIYDPLGFVEMIFPKFEPWDVPKRSGHAESIYPDAYFVMTPKNATPEAWEDVMDHFKVTREIDTKTIETRLESVGILSFAQCPPFWQYLEGKTLALESLPLKVYDWSGPTYRYEKGGTAGLARVEEFHRIETLWVGTPEQVKEIGLAVRKKLTEFFDKVLDLEFKLMWVTPWWMAQQGEIGIIEEEELVVGTVDYDFYLPFRGDRETSEWLEVQNCSIIGEKYPKAFSVKPQKGELWSGCAGGSFQRFIVAFLSQKGFNTKNWPSKVAEKFNEKIKKTKEIKFL